MHFCYRQKDRALARGDIKDLEEELQKLDILYVSYWTQTNDIMNNNVCLLFGYLLAEFKINRCYLFLYLFRPKRKKSNQ